MRDQRNPTPAEVPDPIEQAVLALLTDHRPSLWSDEEIARELGDRVEAADAVAALLRAGLAHRVDRFVFAMPAAVRAVQLA
jgi:hypothetical protein